MDWNKLKTRLRTIKKQLSVFFLSRIDVYFYKELLPNYVFGLIFFTFIMMLNQLFYLIRFYVEYNVPINQVMLLLMNLIPFLLTYTIPIGILPAYLLSMGRFSQDSEIIAMKSCGISTLRIMRPGLIFGVIISLFSIYFTDNVVVPSNQLYVKLQAKIMAQKPVVELKEKAFIQIGGYKISFERMSAENNVEVLYNVNVVDINGRKTIEAEKGRLYSDPENPEHFILKFMNGSISEVMKTKFGADKNKNTEEEKFFVASFRFLAIHSYVNLPQEYYTKGPDMMTIAELQKDIAEKSKSSITQIETYLKDRERVNKDIESARKLFNLDTKSLSKEEVKQRLVELESRIRGMKSQIKSLDREIANYRKNLPSNYLMKLYEKFALPLASFGFALISLSIGMFAARSGRNEGLGISIIIMLSFYGLKLGTENLIFKQILPPITEWIPNLLFLGIGIALLINKIKE